MIVGYNYMAVHHQNHLLVEHSNFLVRTVWHVLCLGHTSASVVIVVTILTELCVMANQKRNPIH
jgi:uncharacterized membrane protein